MSAALEILLIDDDDGDRKQIRRAFKQSGLPCAVGEAASLAEALGVCREKSFDCIFLDYQLPGENGVDGIQKLRELSPYTPIIMATGQGDELVASAAFRSGAQDYLPKALLQPEIIRHICENAISKAQLQRKLAEQKEELERFANVLAHDLRAPLRRVMNFVELIGEELESGDFDEVLRICERVSKSAQRDIDLIDTLYEYTRLNARIYFEFVVLDQAVREAVNNIEAVIEAKHAEIKIHDLPGVYGNKTLLRQLFQNLIANAVKYCDKPFPVVEISCTAVTEADQVVIVVRDNGIGVPAIYQQKIFEPFTRLHDAEKYEGTGLGLATCKKIVERHGGKLCCDSVEGQGSSFYFTLPQSAFVDRGDR